MFPMRHTLLASASLLLLIACSNAQAGHPGFSDPNCCSTYPIYLCQPGFLGYPKPPYELTSPYYQNCDGCNHGYSETAYACGQITPNPYSCCFYGVSLSNYGLITPLGAVKGITSGEFAPAPKLKPEPEKLPKPIAK
jgi:hypothetical protein